MCIEYFEELVTSHQGGSSGNIFFPNIYSYFLKRPWGILILIMYQQQNIYDPKVFGNFHRSYKRLFLKHDINLL